MSKEIYVGVNDTARKVNSIYVGAGGGVARKVRRVYVGDEDGIARLCYDTYTQLTDMTQLTADMFEGWRSDNSSKIVYYDGCYVYAYGAGTICISKDGGNTFSEYNIFDELYGYDFEKVASPNSLAVTPVGLIWVVNFVDSSDGILGAVYHVEPSTHQIDLISFLYDPGKGGTDIRGVIGNQYQWYIYGNFGVFGGTNLSDFQTLLEGNNSIVDIFPTSVTPITAMYASYAIDGDFNVMSSSISTWGKLIGDIIGATDQLIFDGNHDLTGVQLNSDNVRLVGFYLQSTSASTEYITLTSTTSEVKNVSITNKAATFKKVGDYVLLTVPGLKYLYILSGISASQGILKKIPFDFTVDYVDYVEGMNSIFIWSDETNSIYRCRLLV